MGTRRGLRLLAVALVLAAVAAIAVVVVGLSGRTAGGGVAADPALAVHPGAAGTHASAAQPPGSDGPADAVPAGHSSSAPASASTAAPGHGETGTTDPESPYAVLSAELLSVLDDRGPRAALRGLARAIATDPQVSGICHAVAHDLGHAALERVDGDAARALAVSDDVCGGGYTHGVVELALADSRHIARDLRAVCAPDHTGSCYHGVGHGVMFSSGYDIPRSLEVCDTAPTTILSVRCGEGVFMQLFTLDDGAAHMAAPTYEQPTPRTAKGICREVRYPYNGTCWFYAPTVYLQVTPEDWRGVSDWCASAPAGIGRDTCTRGVGSRVVKYHPDDIPFGARVCAKVAADLTDDCLGGMGSYWSVHWEGQRAPSDVCPRLGTARLESACYAATA